MSRKPEKKAGIRFFELRRQLSVALPGGMKNSVVVREVEHVGRVVMLATLIDGT